MMTSEEVLERAKDVRQALTLLALRTGAELVLPAGHLNVFSEEITKIEAATVAACRAEAKPPRRKRGGMAK
jgi:hypothetical protein